MSTEVFKPNWGGKLKQKECAGPAEKINNITTLIFNGGVSCLLGGLSEEGEERGGGTEWNGLEIRKVEVIVILIIIMKMVSRKKTWKRSAVLSFAYT